MIRSIVILFVLAAMFTLSGCGEGMALTSRERSERHSRILETDFKQLNDDWDSFWLNDDISHLTPWRTRSWP
jgi:hypothetical protein